MRTYPSIEGLNRRVEILAVKECIALEKLHGTNMRVEFPLGMTSIDEIRYGGRNEEFGTGESGSFYGGRPVAWFKKQPELLQRLFDTFQQYNFNFSEVTVFGEACGTGIQKGVAYAPPGEVIFRAFDIMVGDNFLTYNLFTEVCDRAQLPRCQEVWRGEPSLSNFDKLLEQHSQEGILNGVDNEKNIAEGVVIRSNPLLRNTFGQYLIIKHKGAKFKEHTSAPKDIEGNQDAASVLAATFVTPGRIMNALGRMRAAGSEVKDDMSDMRNLVPEIVKDILKECEPEWHQAIAEGATELQLKKAIQTTTGNVYRRMLLESAGTS
jgi:Rnl2 family RNA ligase